MEFQVSPELLAIYLEDARVHLEALDHGLLALEREGLDLEVVSAILGPLHTLKGNSGMMGFTGIKDYVHRLEDVLARVRDQGSASRPRSSTCSSPVPRPCATRSSMRGRRGPKAWTCSRSARPSSSS